MKLFLDFDDSLFNTRKFRGELVKIFLSNGVSKKDFFETYYDYPKKTSKGLKKYDPQRQIRILKKKTGIDDLKIKKDMDYFVCSSKKYVFPDSKDFLNNFHKNNLFLISYGYTDFQNEKIKHSGLKDCFFKVVIADGDKAKIVRRYAKKKENFFFIDDRVENINLVKKAFPNSATFLLKRKEGRYNDKKTKAVDFEVRDLRETKKIIEKYSNVKRKG